MMGWDQEMDSKEWVAGLRPWLRAEHAPSFEAALEWLWPRCRTDEERSLAPALLLLLSPLNALVVPCRPAAGSCVNFQVTLSRQGVAGPERARLTVRAESGVQGSSTRFAGTRSGVQAGSPERMNARTPERLTLWLDEAAVADDPLGSAARVQGALLDAAGEIIRRKPDRGART